MEVIPHAERFDSNYPLKSFFYRTKNTHAVPRKTLKAIISFSVAAQNVPRGFLPKLRLSNTNQNLI